MPPMVTLRASLPCALRTTCATALAVALAGCGGGGGSASSSTATAATAVAITQQNSPQAAGAAYQGGNAAQGTGSAGSSAISGLAVDGSGGGLADVGRFAHQQILRLQGQSALPGSNFASGAITPVTVSCDVPPSGPQGTLSATFNDADNSGTLSAGDSLSATLSNCYDSVDGQTSSGSVSVSFAQLTGDPTVVGSDWSTVATFTLTNLSITDATGTQTASGSFTDTESVSGGGVTDNMSLSGASLSIAQGGGPTLILENFQLTGTTDLNTTAYSEYGSGRVSDSALGGYVDFTIPAGTPLQGIGSQNPSSGSITVTGANNSRIVLTAIDSTSVQLQVDTNGDGVADYTVTKPWSAIAP